MARTPLGFSLRLKITASFVVLVLGGAAVSTIIGSRIITRALLAHATRRVEHGVDSAQIVYLYTLQRAQRIVMRAASSLELAGAAEAGDRGALQRLLAGQQRNDSALDFLGFSDPSRRLSAHAAADGGAAGIPGATRMTIFAAAAAGRPARGTDVLAAPDLVEESARLARRAVVRRANGRLLTSALVIGAAAPVRGPRGQLGVVYGGILLNHDTELVDQIRTLVFGPPREEGETGVISIFLGDIRIATNLLTGGGARAIGAPAPGPVAEHTFRASQRWQGRAEVLGGRYITAYQPIKNAAGGTIGILGVGVDERPFLAVRTEMMLSFMVVAAIGVLIVLGLTYLITRSMILPLEAMVAGTKRIAAGDLDYRVQVRAGDEIGALAASFNKMLDALREMKGELQDWAHNLEEKVRARTQELVAVQASMVQSEKLASLGRLAAGVAHEINNPLGGILALSMLALEDSSAEDPRWQQLELISKQALRCRDIVRGLLEFSRQSDVPATPSQVNAVVQSTLSLLTSQSIFMNIKVAPQLADRLPPIRIDPGHLQQVIMNLTLNAVDAMEQSGQLSVSTSRAPDGSVLLAIGDTGKGVPKEILPLIFEPFFTTKKVGQGTGLGLAIVHGIVTRSGGRVDVDTSPAGTTFRVYFPVAAGDEELGGGGSPPA